MTCLITMVIHRLQRIIEKLSKSKPNPPKDTTFYALCVREQRPTAVKTIHQTRARLQPLSRQSIRQKETRDERARNERRSDVYPPEEH